MADQAAFAQLLDMGIPGGRARAALRRSKGDVMSAAERVFAGEFDDIPSDDEEAEGTMPTGLQIPKKTPSRTPTGSASDTSQRLNEDNDDEDVDMLDGDSESNDDEDEDLEGDFGDDELHEDQLLSDPYAGIFFSKDRTENIVEPVEKEALLMVTVPHTSGVSLRNAIPKSVQVRILGRGEWMSGCPEGNEQSFLFQLYSMLADECMPCSGGCGHVLQRKPSDFFSLFTDFATYTSYLKGIIRPVCPKCERHTCLACGERVDRPSPLSSLHSPASLSMSDGRKRQNKLPAAEELLHCPNIQGVLLGVGLHMIEQAFSNGSRPSGQTGSTSAEGSSPKKPKTGLLSGIKGKLNLSADIDEDEDYDSDLADWESGFGRRKSAAKGTGYAGGAKEDRSGQVRAEKAQREADKKTTTLLNQVSVFLPSFDRPGGARASDHLVHPTALAHLRRRSAFVNDLLRNDSLLDMTNRGELYRALFDWLEIVSNHEALASMLAMPQMRASKISPSPDAPNQVIVTYEGASSPRELLESCVIQAQAALKSLQGFAAAAQEEKDETMTEEDKRISMAEQARREREKKEDEKHDPNVQMRLFCERIIHSAQIIDRSLQETKGKPFVERMKAGLPRLPDCSAPILEEQQDGLTDQEIVATYERWAGQARFQYCDMSIPGEGSSTDKVNYYHAYNSSIQTLEGLDMAKRSLAIAKELAVLTTSLPVAWHSTIFLRVDEARVDVLKAMIIGPEGTPYENGCFIFDIFLPLDYSAHCPHVKSMTTNGGKFRYNPNLYADGKVCLSLLGTWSGPGWISGQSTLLQALISIQSLILCEEPYLNEPGWADQAGSTQSKAYSANIRRMTLIDAMANNIRTPPRPFENEVKTHFRLKARSIREQIKKWKTLDDGQQTKADSYGGPGYPSTTINLESTAFDKAAEGVLRLLDELEGKADRAMGKGEKGKKAVTDEAGEGNPKGRGKEKLGKKEKIAKAFLM
ncbi:hypothetical protein IAT40_003165 [Kwoniella sp. CBS 6097]